LAIGEKLGVCQKTIDGLNKKIQNQNSYTIVSGCTSIRSLAKITVLTFFGTTKIGHQNGAPRHPNSSLPFC
jgi:hypothetical protein